MSVTLLDQGINHTNVKIPKPQKTNLSSGFKPLKGVSVVILDGKGTQTPLPVVQKDNELFAKKGASYIRLRSDGRVGNKLAWDEFQVNQDIVWTYGQNTLGHLVLVTYEDKQA
jgi:hypothetical protein